jgi:hypothetical protein
MDTELIQAADQWQQAGQALRAKLIAERDALSARLAEINKRLSLIPATESEGDRESRKAEPDHRFNGAEIKQGDGVSDVVRKILKASNVPLLATEIIDAVETVLPDTRRPTVHSILNQWAKRRHVLKTGAKGKSRFFWNGARD